MTETRDALIARLRRGAPGGKSKAADMLEADGRRIAALRQCAEALQAQQRMLGFMMSCIRSGEQFNKDDTRRYRALCNKADAALAALAEAEKADG